METLVKIQYNKKFQFWEALTSFGINKENTLKGIAYDAKGLHKNDKSLVRMIINDSCDSISSDLNLSDHQRDLLANYACTLHPKN